MYRIVMISILLTALATACATSTEEQAPEPAPITRAAPPAPEPEPVPAALDEVAVEETVVMLPNTASQAPALALAGGLSIALAGVVGVIRRRLF